MVERAIALVNTFVNIPEANTAIINVPNGYWYLRIGGAERLLTPDPLLAKTSCAYSPMGLLAA